jgi:excinuclease ABC subunit C
VIEELKAAIASIPEQPGIYQYLDAAGTIIYVGKAKNLKKRVTSYFVKTHDNAKTRVLVKNIRDIRYIVTNSELDALLLENSLIKEHQPRYNIQLRDDKTYPWLVIRHEPFPRIHATRNPVKDGSEYFGPYASVVAMRNLLDLAKKLYPLRSCSYPLNDLNIQSGKFRECLEFHIGNCLAPCTGRQTQDEYMDSIHQIRQIIKGNIGDVIRQFKVRMAEHAQNLEFERAQQIKDKLQTLERYQANTTIIQNNQEDLDILGMVKDDKELFINYMRVINGSLLHSFTTALKPLTDEQDDELLQMVLIEMRGRFGSQTRTVLSPMPLPVPMDEIRVLVPQKGDKRKLLDLSERNARFFMLDKHKQQKLKDPDRHTERILNTLMKDLRMKQLPRHIECFDNSNFQGTNAVSACVVFRNARPSKQDYRHFNITTVDGPNDFASMEEAVQRRYKRLLEDGDPLPDLIVIDGGKGQLGAAIQSLERLGIRGKVAIVGIAKRLEEIYFPEDPVPLYIDKRSESLKVIQHLRNEAHRFGITHHRNKRSKAALHDNLSAIPGVGEATAKALRARFKSTKRMMEAGEDAIAEVVGKARARKIMEHFNANPQPTGLDGGRAE